MQGPFRTLSSPAVSFLPRGAQMVSWSCSVDSVYVGVEVPMLKFFEVGLVVGTLVVVEVVFSSIGCLLSLFVFANWWARRCLVGLVLSADCCLVSIVVERCLVGMEHVWLSLLLGCANSSFCRLMMNWMFLPNPTSVCCCFSTPVWSRCAKLFVFVVDCAPGHPLGF